MSLVKLNPRVELWPSAVVVREDIIGSLFASCVRWLGSVMLVKDSRCFRGSGGFGLQVNIESSCLKIDFRHLVIVNGGNIVG